MTSKLRDPTLRQIGTMVKSYFPHHHTTVEELTDYFYGTKELHLHAHSLGLAESNVLRISMGNRVTAGTQRRIFVAAAEIIGKTMTAAYEAEEKKRTKK